MHEKKLREIEEMAATIRELATPGMGPKALIDAVRQRHPKATKKEVARAAFMSVIHSTEHDPGYTQELHDLAMKRAIVNPRVPKDGWPQRTEPLAW